MTAIRWQAVLAIGQGCVMIHHVAALFRGRLPQPVVQFGDPWRAVKFALPRHDRRRRDQAQHDGDFVRARQADHGEHVVLKALRGGWPDVTADVIGAGQRVDRPLPKVERVCLEARQYLRRGLAGDAAANAACLV